MVQDLAAQPLSPYSLLHAEISSPPNMTHTEGMLLCQNAETPEARASCSLLLVGAATVAARD